MYNLQDTIRSAWEVNLIGDVHDYRSALSLDPRAMQSSGEDQVFCALRKSIYTVVYTLAVKLAKQKVLL